MNSITKIMTAVLTCALLLLGSCGDIGFDENAKAATRETVAAKAEAAEAVGFSVNGNMLLDGNGNDFIMRGVNHAHTWYKDKADTALGAIAATGANTVRLVLANGIQWTKDDEASVAALIEKCKALKMIAVVEVHDGTGSDDPAVLEKIADYWIEIKDALIGNEAYVILNIANEWFGGWGEEKWADAYISVIPRLRQAGIKNTIMADASGWGQYGASVAKQGKRVLEADPLGNTMFSIHFYGTSGGTKASIKRNIDDALSAGLCVCAGEFGYTHSDGDVKEDFLMKYCEETGVGWLGWSWKGNSGGVEYLDIATEWDGSKLSADWGEVLVNGENGIKQTSKKCTVFE